ncbi:MULTISPECIES: hypothetical protein [unclassified Saccharibacter]|uniref:hypothetical protein n=1 Tax=unclassified Saccharibacter TaxID=2648722 RepID=UPI001328DB3B|nr:MULTISPECIES: hypothetical protein [unclassified Saccharibacter]MXV35727.1 hypothetical protein [Saccharibacter sp. EH611]MXV58340.1 hypothetical protein [Saccharibacter sp. EH70]MXV65811.1 hypothetical protein [Saccharibacter sp. EH60]
MTAEAKKNERTMNAQVVFMVRNEMKKEEALGQIAKPSTNASTQPATGADQ